jgi:CDP-paratose 2-epimerase
MSRIRNAGTKVVDIAPRNVLITGGAGFIGTNVAHRLLSAGRRVVIFDSLARPGVDRNLAWLRNEHGDRVTFRQGDVRDAAAVREAVRGASEVFHFAAQVAVTTSLASPVEDFEINARGTLNVLEAVRTSAHRPALFFTSTNKVYGGLDDLLMDEGAHRYAPSVKRVLEHGIGEWRPLDFHSPYGCSKGTADQYIHDYARSYGLRTVVFRMSCIYGPHQFGTEDQGWVAHFLIRTLNRQPITIYGDGKQVRDILFVDDLVDAFMLASENIQKTAGHAFNIGGGVANTISLLELIQTIRKLDGRPPKYEFSDWRTGDQKYYVSDTRKFTKMTGWQPRVSARDGIRLLREWLVAAGVPAIVASAEEQPMVAKGAVRVAVSERRIDRPTASVTATE